MKDEMQLKVALMSGARSAGICAEGYDIMRGSNRDALINYYLSCPDWCLERGFPSLEMLRREFSDCENKGVYIDKDFHGQTFSERQVYIFHHCRGYINVAMDYDNGIIPMLYFANDCDITVGCSQKNDPPIVVPVYMTDEWANLVNLCLEDGCEFKEYTIKRIEP